MAIEWVYDLQPCLVKQAPPPFLAETGIVVSVSEMLTRRARAGDFHIKEPVRGKLIS